MNVQKYGLPMSISFDGTSIVITYGETKHVLPEGHKSFSHIQEAVDLLIDERRKAGGTQWMLG